MAGAKVAIDGRNANADGRPAARLGLEVGEPGKRLLPLALERVDAKVDVGASRQRLSFLDHAITESAS